MAATQTLEHPASRNEFLKALKSCAEVRVYVRITDDAGMYAPMAKAVVRRNLPLAPAACELAECDFNFTLSDDNVLIIG